MLHFHKDAFRNPDGSPKVAVVSPIFKRYSTRDFINHFHTTVYQGNTALMDYARQALHDTGLPVLAAKKGSPYVRLPEGEWPGDDRSTFVQKDGRLFLRLDRLPDKYFPDEKEEGGLGDSRDFILPYGQLYYFFADFGHEYGLDWKEEPFVNSPDPITAAHQFVFPGGDDALLKSLLRFGLKKKGLWHESFEHFNYIPSGCAVIIRGASHSSRGVDYSLLPGFVGETGGYVDFYNENAYGTVMCNFTVTGKTITGEQTAIVQAAQASGRLNNNQKKFRDDVFEAFDIKEAT